MSEFDFLRDKFFEVKEIVTEFIDLGNNRRITIVRLTLNNGKIEYYSALETTEDGLMWVKIKEYGPFASREEAIKAARCVK
ncbi:MAG: hypothetical protein QW699_00265 [Metallosphaera sp.]|uniref:hypothetical protein n=1 Tax=Saccharolobus sp. TaxID=2100761 RepID=UPI00316226BE